MSMSNEMKEYLQRNADAAWDIFQDELSTDENKDYRRGFRAGILCAFLQLKADLTDFTAKPD